MRKANWVGVAILIGTTGLVLGQPAPQPAPPQPPANPQPAPMQAERVTRFGQGINVLPGTLKGRIAVSTKLPEADVAKVLDAVGPAIRDLLGRGQTVEVMNLGTFRVVRVPEHRDLVDGRPATIAGTNSVEFLPTGAFAAAANQPGVKPAETVPPFEYNPLPDQTRGLKTGSTRAPNARTP
jgi:nucleoid DNA-binding protein